MPNTADSPQLTLEVDRKETTTIVHCHGKLVYGVTDVLYSNVSKLIPESKRIVLDLSELAYMDSMGLGVLMRLYVSAKTKGCEVELIHIGKRVREMLELTKVLDVFGSVGEHGMRF
jgi:anti-anti-sigma factor